MKRAALALCLFLVLLVPIVPLSQSDLVLADAESSITKPAVPEFTVQFVAYPYDVPTTHSIDPYTGQDITHQGYRVENKSIEVRIKNQPFNPYWIIDADSDTNMTVVLHYNVWVKGHFSENWTNVYSLSDGLPTQDSGEYTVFSLPVSYPSGAQLDFKVAAMAGYVHRPIDPASGWPIWRFTGEESWSNIQTITIDENAPTATPDAQQGFNWTEISFFAALGVIVALLVVITLMYRKQTKK